MQLNEPSPLIQARLERARSYNKSRDSASEAPAPAPAVEVAQLSELRSAAVNSQLDAMKASHLQSAQRLATAAGPDAPPLPPTSSQNFEAARAAPDFTRARAAAAAAAAGVRRARGVGPADSVRAAVRADQRARVPAGGRGRRVVRRRAATASAAAARRRRCRGCRRRPARRRRSCSRG